MKAAAYARFSSDNQREESIDAQLRAIREYAERNGHEIVAEYIDEAKSATSDKRPEFQRIIADSAQEDFQMVIVHKLDRFSRDRFDSAFYRRELKKNGVLLKSVLENLDGSPESIILESVLEGMAEYYSKNLAREVMKGLKETAYQCKHTGGSPPLGFDVAPDNTYIINEREAESIRLIFSMYADGKGYTEIINALADYRTRAGNRFGKNSLADILRNEKYHGVYTYNRTGTMPNGKRNNHANKSDDEMIRIPGGMPQIIDDETWERVQDRLHNNKRNATNRAKAVYLLSGKLICGECGSTFVARSTRKTEKVYRYYFCGTRDRKSGQCDMPRLIKEDIEGQVIDEIAKFLSFDIETALDVLEEMFSSAGEPQEVITARKELKRIEREIFGIVAAFKSGAVHPVLIDELNALKVEEERYKKICQFKRELPTREELKEFLLTAAKIKEKTEEEQKIIIDKLIDKIVIHADKPLELKWRVRLSSGASHPHQSYAYCTVQLQKKSRR